MKQTNHRFPRRLRRLGMLAIALVIAFSLSTQVRAQVTGTKTVAASGGDYTSLAAAITDLNTNGVGTGGAIINVPANWTETAPVGGYVLGSATLNASLSSIKTLTIQKSGAGTNPLLTAPVGTITETYYLGLGDGIFDLKGVDYVTIDGIDLVDPASNSTIAQRMQHGYGLFKLNATAPLDGCQNNTIKNCTITLSANTATGTPTTVGIYLDNRVSGTAGALALNSAASDANSYNRFYTNTIQKVGVGIFARGFYNSAALTNFDTNNDFGGSALANGNTIRSFAGGQTAGVSGAIILVNQVNPNASYNTINNLNGGAFATTGPTGGTMYGIYNINSATLTSTALPTTSTAIVSLNSNGTFNYNTFTMTTGNGAGSTVPVYCIYNYYMGGSFSFQNNSITFASNNGSGANGSAMYGIYNYYSGNGGAGSYNYVKNNTITGTFAHSSPFYGIYNYGYNMIVDEFSGNTCTSLTRNLSTTGSSYIFTNYASVPYLTPGTTCNIFNNVITGVTMNNTTGNTYAWYLMSGAYTSNIYNNTVSNIINAGTGSVYGMYGPYYYFGAGGLNFYGNTVDNITANTTTGTAGGGTIYGIYNYAYYGAGTQDLYNNTVSNLKCGGNTGTIYGWYNYYNNTTQIIRNNKIIGLQNNSTLAGASNIYGIYDNTFAGPSGAVGTLTYQNNLVHTGNYNVMADSTKSSGGNYGIYITSGSARTVNFYYNTVYVTGKSTQPAYGPHVVFNNTSTTAAKMLLVNNILYNQGLNASAVPTSKSTCIRLIGSLATTYDASSNRNSFYLNSPNATDRFYYYDGTTGYNTMAGTQTVLAPRESSSFVENVAFLSTTPSNANLFKINTTTPTQLEGNATQISGITTDYAATVRQGNVGYAGTSTVGPDIGAYEGNYTALDLMAPSIAHTPLSLTCNTGDRSFTAVISDATGVDITTNVPYIYFKKNSGTWYSAAGTLVSGTSASSTWSFTISAATMGGLVATDVVSYFLATQDLAGTPNVGSLPAGAVLTNTATLTSAPSSPYTYAIGNQLSGIYQVGAGKAATGGFNTLTAAANAYNTYCLSGNVVFELTDTLYSTTTETFPITFGVNAFASSTNNLTIRPAAGMNPYFRANNQTAFIKLNGADYITIDGSNNGTTSRNLNFYSTNTAANLGIWVASLGGAGNGATYNTIKNCNIRGTVTVNGTTIICGIRSASTGSQTGNAEDNDNLTIQNNSISGAYVAISLQSSAGSLSSDNALITRNDIGSLSGTYSQTTAPAWFVNYRAIEITNNTNAVISNNNIDGIWTNGFINSTGIEVGANTNLTIDANKIHGIYSANTGGYGAYGINVSGVNTGLLMKNNMIYDLFTVIYSTTGTTYSPFGIRFTANCTGSNIYNNSVNLYGSVSNNTAAGMSACLLFTSAQTNMNFKNNILVNTQKSVITGSKFYSIYCSVNPTFASWDNNDYYGTTSATTPFGAYYTGYLTSDRASLLNWKGAMGGTYDTKSIDIQPNFVSNTDLHLNFGTTPTLFESGGVNLASVTTDFDGDSRPGPAGSVNGGGTTNDIGADEFDGTPLPLCATPVAGTTTIPSTLICPNQPFTVSLSGNTSPAAYGGITFQWMISTNGGTTWNTIAGANAASYTSPGVAVPVLMHCVVACSYSGAADSSTNVSLTFNNYYNCYCNVTHTYNYTSSAYGNITNVTFAGINHNSSTTMTSPFYTVVPNTVSGTVIAGQTYNLNVTLDYGYSSVVAWIDWNANGTFEASEYYNLGANGNSTTTFSTSITAPTNLSSAVAKIRIRGGYYYYPPSAADACTNGGASSATSFYYGESMDYFLTLVGIPATPANPVEGATPVSCTAGTSLSPVGSPASGIVWYWQTSATGTSKASADSVSGPITIYGNGTYYIRAYNPTYNLWSSGAGTLVVTDFPAGPSAPANPVAAANPACYTGTTVTAATAPVGETYYWQTTPTGTSTTNNATSAYSVSATSTVYVRSQNATGCWSSGAGSVAVTILPNLAGSTFSHTIASNCSVGGAGTIVVNAPSAAPLLPWYSNTFNGAFTNGPAAAIFGTALVSGGKMICNQAAASQAGGGIQVFNPSNLNANAFQIDFDLETTYGNGNADGISYSFGDDVVQIPSTAAGGNGTNPENGSGTKLKLSFDAYANGSNTAGIYLMYNCNVANQAPTTTGVLGYVANTTWCGGSSGTPVSKHISITITSAGKITVMLGNTVIFNQVQLPNGYLAANKSTWSHVFVSRTGSVYQEHNIDNFVVQYNDINYYQYSNNGGSTWQSANNFNVPVGIYPMAITYNSNNACSSQLGNDTISAPRFVSANSNDSVCTYYAAMPTLSFSPSFTADSILWESSPMGTSTWTTIAGAKGSTYVPTVTVSTDYRAAMYCAGSVLYRTDSNSVWAITPTITSTSQSVTPCGIGTATIGATASTGATVNWYTTSAGGVPTATGTSYTTPTLLGTTNFYTSASIGGSGALTIPGDGGWNHVGASGSFQTTTITGAYMILTVLTPVTLTSMDIYPSATVGTSFSVEARTGSASGTTFATYSGVTTVANSGTPSVAQTLNVNWVLPAGTYYIGFPTTNPNTWRTSATHTFPWTLPGIASLDYYLTPSYQYYFYNIKLGTGCASTPQAVAATVLTAPSISATVTAATDTVCAGGSSSLNVTSANANYAYTWTPGSLTGAAQTVTPTPTTTVQTLNDYIVSASDAGTGCSARDTVRVVVNPNPAAVSVSPNSPHMLVGSPQMLTATGGTNGFNTVATLGTGVTTSGTNNITPYSSNWEGIRTQYLIRASELNALGIYAGNLTSIAFNCTSPSTGSPYNPQLNFTMKMGTTALTALSGSAYVATTGFTTVLSPRTLTLPTTGWNTYTFSTPFYWNGTSNIIIDMCNENDPSGTGGALYSGNSTVTTNSLSYTCQYGQYADNVSACGQTSIGTASSGTVRPNMKFGYSSFNANPFYWTPAQSLYMNANASTAYTAGGAANIVYANPRLDSVYTVTALNLTTGCSTTTKDTVFVEQPPVNYNCANASTLTITAACNYTTGSSKWGWYNPSAIPTTPATPTTATCGNADDDVWYTFSRPAGMTTVTVKVVGSNNYDVAFEILTGACGGTQTVVACVNNTSAISNSTEQYQIVVPSGAPAATYYVRVYDARTGYGSGTFDICVSGVVPPPVNNDPCGAANFSTNLASWGGASTILAAYDGGSPVFMGQANNSTSNPPTGVNLVYFTGSTAYANNLGANEPTPPCGNLGSNAKTVWFKFKAPTIGGVDVTLRSLFNGNPTNFSTILAAYAVSVDPCTGTPTYTNIGCATTGVLSLTAASTVLAPYAGQFIYVQLAGNGASSPVGSYMLSIQAVPQNIALSNPNTSSLTVTLPTAPGATNVSIQWRAVGSSGYSLVNVSPSVGTYTITGLTSGVNYQVWAKYYNNAQAFYTNFATLGTTVGCSANPVAPSILPVPNHCSRDTVQWPAHPLASTAFPYRLYWKQAASTGGYSVFAVPTSAYNATTGKVNVLLTNLAVNTAYQFYYRVLCAGGAQVVSGITNYTQCNGPAKLDGTFHGSFEHNGRYFVDADFVDVTSFTDNTPADGNVHEVVLNEVSDMNAVLNGSGVKVASNGEENGAFELIPNPTSDNVFVEYNLANAGRVVIRVMNIQGKVVKEEVLDNSDASGAVQIDLSDVQSGVYMVSVDAPGYKATKRLVVTK